MAGEFRQSQPVLPGAGQHAVCDSSTATATDRRFAQGGSQRPEAGANPAEGRKLLPSDISTAAEKRQSSGEEGLAGAKACRSVQNDEQLCGGSLRGCGRSGGGRQRRLVGSRQGSDVVRPGPVLENVGFSLQEMGQFC